MNCPATYLMSQVIGRRGRNTWSTCSLDQMRKTVREKDCFHKNTSPKELVAEIHDALPGDICNADCQVFSFFFTF